MTYSQTKFVNYHTKESIMAMDIKTLENKIAELTVAERITKRLLGELSRDLLELYVENGDVGLINALLGKDPETGKYRLTPMNRRIAGYYFNQFIPHASNYDVWVENMDKTVLEFASKSKRKVKRFEGKEEHSIDAWLALETNTIWNWSAENVETKNNADVDYAQLVAKAFQKALDAGCSKAELIDALGLTAADFRAEVEAAVAPEQAKELVEEAA